MSFSYWENKHLFRENQIVIIGGGIVGVSAAISCKKMNPDVHVVVIEKCDPPQGASTKNAGFICYGSLSEIIADTKIMTQQEVCNIIAMRWQGVQILKGRLSPDSYSMSGGLEFWSKDQDLPTETLFMVNDVFEQATSIKNYMQIIPNKFTNQMNDYCISLPHEGMLDPMQMMVQLYQLARRLGVLFIMGQEVLDIDQENRCLHLGRTKVHYLQCIVATNGFARHLLPQLYVSAVRNQVIISEELSHQPLQHVCHFDEGYFYFRPVGRRILIGGARNKDRETETTDAFGINNYLIDYLTDFAKSHITVDFEAAMNWSGILGVGCTKTPILEDLGNGLIVGVRLGGMGVAIGSYLGEELAKLVHKS